VTGFEREDAERMLRLGWLCLYRASRYERGRIASIVRACETLRQARQELAA
jgi:hypothetical protein